MLVVVSPAKKLDWNPVEARTTAPDFQDEALALTEVARGLSVEQLQKLMSLSANLATLNYDRFKAFEAEPDAFATRPAVRAFAGDTYTGLEAASLDAEEMAWAQDHLRILSGLYGVLRPLDAIQPYRLEMGSRLKNPRGKNLYEFWGSQISSALNAQAKDTGSHVLVNCASQEYFGAVDLDALKLRVITPVFMEDKGGLPKIVSFYAKKARGSMARFIIQRRLTDPEGLKDFDLGGYAYQPDMSEGDRWVFLRNTPEA
ncbi:peroxide stress protein YaaA [Shimia sp. FJ5]|uniref:peroxide stress protein YaaA n=1 Tax=Shimia sp. FJ5 TaxID=3079054 RepID=UPI0026304D3C|nr:peroxide stress protein YaaA [Shimia sp. FJ5]MDV4144762.1 peroxide stress protein YaaA [Shimia sp. FJ5]